MRFLAIRPFCVEWDFFFFKRAAPFSTEKRRGPLKRVPKGSLLGPFWDPFGTIRSNRKGFSRFLEGSGGRLGVSWGRSGGFGCRGAAHGHRKVSIEAHLAILGASSPPIGLGGMREAL